MKRAEVISGVVVNVAEFDPDNIPGWAASWPKVTDGAGIGWGWDGSAFTAPPAPDPAEALAAERAGMIVSKFQAKVALLQAGLLSQVETAIQSADAVTQLAWAEANEFHRDSPAIAALSAAIGLSETEVDDLFRAAAVIAA
ncbi:hypothetical protein DDZ14_08560 [Maritimibacter sp. 55A14]|uniref:hypothetical protein n=1 Tax=Maritimibacter sp. 55A14 TaxID=2174844 RepID=UPI000D61547D|nr:hypothetical protein [Maritimibacter sp. 55A14]PWE32788.1 hypothetical protein DDZ14_08560 [Maritimibacter sp. 55A14]